MHLDRPEIHPTVQLFRPPKTGELRCLLLSSAWIAHSTHFTNRSRICPGQDNCPLCAEQLPPRWIAWIAAAKSSHDIGVLELTSYLADQIAGHADSSGSLAGCVITVTRDRCGYPRLLSVAPERKVLHSAIATTWTEAAVRRIHGLPQTETWRDAAAALLRHDMMHGTATPSCLR
jgi:hypothetical protein